MAIRYDKELNKEINKTIKNFNQKITRLQKLENDLILPSKITKAELKESVYTRQELKRKLNQLRSYSIRGSEKTVTTEGGVNLSLYELRNIQKESRRIKANLTREINKLEITSPTVFGKKQATTYAQMGDQYYLNLKARRVALEKGRITKLNPNQFKQFVNLIERTNKNRTYYNNIFKDNYLKMLTDMGYYYGYDNKKLQELQDKLAELNSNEFLKLFREEKSIQAILDYYPNIVVKPNSFNIKPEDIKEDVTNLYDALIDNIDNILADYA